VVERFIGHSRQEAERRGLSTNEVIREGLSSLSEMVGGYDFAEVVGAYWRGHEEGREDLKSSAVRWLRAEYTTKTDARRDLGVRTIIDDANFYDQIKLLARFVQVAGYGGLLVGLDEMVNLYKLAHTGARTSNYEQILRIVNDCLQGSVENLGFVMGGTPEFLTDTRRGLYSYEALHSRLAENTFAQGRLRDMSGPVMRLANLSPEELFILLTKLRDVHANGAAPSEPLPDEAITAFMEHCNRRIGARYFQTPRNSIKAFVQLLVILEQNEDASWRDLLDSVAISEDVDPDLEPVDDPGTKGGASDTRTAETLDPGDADDGLATFRL
jgi:hypothetical protein